ncbi:MFS transporter [Simonsiella muelleri]|uniref:MFS transporter n=1 Tax=Simonsiella muelleri TaxID=72 RepID=UPI0023F246D5|nr:MFS transporter [Simonsiella muelleri]
MTHTNTSYLKLWLFVLAVAFILMVTIGMRMTLGLFVQPLVNTTTLSIAQVSLAIAITQLMWGVSQPLSGALSDRFGTWTVLWVGTTMLVIGWLLTSFFPTQWGLLLGMGVLVALGMGAGSWSILMSLIANRLPERMRGTASGVANAGGSFGQFVFAPMLQGLISLPAVGWKGAMWVLAAWAVLILPTARWLTHGMTAPQTVPLVAHASHDSIKKAIKQAVKNRNYILLHLGFATCGFHVAFLATHLPTEIALCGLPVSVASTSLAIVGIANLVGSLIVGWCVGRWRNKSILATLYAIRVGLIAVYIFMPRTDMNFYIFAAGLGLTWLATVPPTAALTGKLFGTRYLATLFGLTLLSHQIGGFLGAYLGGKAIVVFGDYGWMWYADLGLAGLAAILNWAIREPKIKK